MLSISRFMGPRSPRPCSAFISQLEKTIKGNQLFMQTVESWRNLQIKYIGQLMELQTKIRDHVQQFSLQADIEFLQILQTVVKSHKNLIFKINQQIFETSYSNFCSIIQQQKNILAEQKKLNKDFTLKKEEVNKFRQKHDKIKKSLYEQLMQQVFCHNSITQSRNKQKIVKKTQQMFEQKDCHGQKMREAIQLYEQLLKKTKQSLRRFDIFQNNFSSQTLSVIIKARNSINSFANSLLTQFTSTSTTLSSFSSTSSALQKFQCEEEATLTETALGYLETTIQLIRNRTLDDVTSYTKDKQIKKKIKAVIESQEVSPQFTDEITRQVQLVKKMLRTKQMNLMDQFKNIINKSWKSRLNYIFMLQLYRINSQFEMTQNQIQPIIILINELLKISHQKRDAFILKQTIILLLTYYIKIKVEETEHNIYILEFFKKKSIWRDLQLWESMLIESIYIEKKATIRMLLTASCISDNTELAEAEKTLVLNQILYIVKNMILFDFTEKQVKQFANKFVKLLKLDDKFLKQVYKNIDSAIKQQAENQYPAIISLEKHEFYKLVIDD